MIKKLARPMIANLVGDKDKIGDEYNMVTTKTAMGEEQFKLYQEKEYPNPQSIPRPPSTYEPKPQVALGRSHS